MSESAAAERGVLYMVWGEGVESVLDRSMKSLRHFHPELPIHVERMPTGSSFLDKARMFACAPFEQTLFLDADTVVLDRLDFGFEMAQRFGLACCICECPWARRYGDGTLRGDLVEYNTGVLFFAKAAAGLFGEWEKQAAAVDSSIVFYRGQQLCRMPCNDQAGFAKAVAETHFNPFVLPCNWNFRPKWQRTLWGPIKIWHDYDPVPEPVERFVAGQREESSVIRWAQFA